MPNVISTKQENGGLLQILDDGTQKFLPMENTRNSVSSLVNGDIPKVVSSTDNIRTDRSILEGNINKMDSLLSDNSYFDTVLNSKPYGETDQGRSDLDMMREQLKNMNVLSNSEAIDVSNVGAQEAGNWNGLINEAEQAKMQGLPKAMIGAGEAGGFMNTQFSGVAALLPTIGENFFGAGGELERVKSVYDNNISSLNAQKTQAVEAARQAAKKAILSGKRADYEAAATLYEKAKQSHDEAMSIAMEKMNVIQNLEQKKYDREKDQRTVLDAEQKKKQENYGTGLEKINNLVAGNIPLESVSPEEQAFMETSLGLNPGELPNFYAKLADIKKSGEVASAAQGAQEAKANQLEMDIKIAGLLKDVPVGTSINIGGKTYQGIKKEAVKTTGGSSGSGSAGGAGSASAKAAQNGEKTDVVTSLTKAQQDEIVTIDTMQGLIDQVKSYNADGKLEGIGSFGRGTLYSALGQMGFSSEEAMSVRAIIGNIKATIAKIRGGTSFTENEEKLLNTYTPDINDDPGVAMNKLELLSSYLADKRSKTIEAAQGVSNKASGSDVPIEDLRKKYNY